MLKGAIETSQYRDLRFKAPKDKVEDDIHKSTTLYVGNLSFFTTEEQIYELFSRCGEIKRIIMGLDKFKRTPCGFCFVEYYTRADAQACVYYINGSRLDDRMIRVDWDAGFKEGRQYGRGKSGGQVRDEYRTDYDSGRGGYGKIVTVGITPPPPAGLPPMAGIKRSRDGEMMMPTGALPGPYPPMMPPPPFGIMMPGAGGLLPPPAKRARRDDWDHQQRPHHPPQPFHHQHQHQHQQHPHHRPQHQHHNQQQHQHHQPSSSSSSRSSNPRFRERHDHDSDEDDDM